MSTMKAVRAHKRGGPEVLRYEDAPVPEMGASEVLVEVHAAAVTPGELAWDETWQSADGADRTPIVPSHEFSGVIAQVVRRPELPDAGHPGYVQDHTRRLTSTISRTVAKTCL